MKQQYSQINQNYNILNFIGYIQAKDTRKYEQLQNELLIISLFKSFGVYSDEGMKSSYVATWGNKLRVCGHTSLDINQLEILVNQDILKLRDKGIHVLVRQNKRIRSVRRL